jgi:Rap1a immunity proteins
MTQEHLAMRYPICFAGILLFAATGAAAEQPNVYSGFFSFPACKAYVDEKAQFRMQLAGNFCAGQLRALAYVSHILPSDLRSCVPDGLPNGQLAIVAVRFLETHPQRMHEDFMALALQAYREAWPCKKGET